MEAWHGLQLVVQCIIVHECLHLQLATCLTKVHIAHVKPLIGDHHMCVTTACLQWF